MIAAAASECDGGDAIGEMVVAAIDSGGGGDQ